MFHGNGKFLYSSFHEFTNQDIIELLENNGLAVKEERGNRIFPVTDKAQSVVDCLLKELKKYNIEIRLKAEVKKVLVKDGKVTGVELIDKEIISADKVILATGGKSYSSTGSNRRGLWNSQSSRTYYYRAKRVFSTTYSRFRTLSKFAGFIFKKCKNFDKRCRKK